MKKTEKELCSVIKNRYGYDSVLSDGRIIPADETNLKDFPFSCKVIPVGMMTMHGQVFEKSNRLKSWSSGQDYSGGIVPLTVLSVGRGLFVLMEANKQDIDNLPISDIPHMVLRHNGDIFIVFKLEHFMDQVDSLKKEENGNS